MRDGLAVELVEHIVRFATASPNGFKPRLLNERQVTLLSLCKVSRTMCAVAQPALYKAVVIRTDEQLDLFLTALRSNSNLGALVKRIRIFTTSPKRVRKRLLTLDAGRLQEMGRLCPAVHEVCVVDKIENREGEPVVDVAAFEAFPNLRILISSGGLVTASRPYVLPSLHEFSLDECFMPAADDPYFTLESVPALCALHYYHSDTWEPRVLASSELTHRIELFSYGFHYQADCDPYCTSDIPSNFLFSITFDILYILKYPGWPSVIRHLRLLRHLGKNNKDLERPIDKWEPKWVDWLGKSGLSGLVRLIEQGKLPHLKDLYLPDRLDPASPETLPDAVSAAVSQLLVICDTCDVKVVFERRNPDSDSMISRDFLRRRLEEREEKERQGTA
ncbi:hypothetical protein JCM8547_001529 [Rhodosporidiobolus lusitaniae]